jgi:predicted metal-dependent peptidase
VAYFTDGDGEAPAAKPKGVEVVWVLTGAWAEVPAKWGRVVRMGAQVTRYQEMVLGPGVRSLRSTERQSALVSGG